MRSRSLLLIPILVATLGASAFAKPPVRIHDWDMPVDAVSVGFRGRERHTAAASLATLATNLGARPVHKQGPLTHRVTIYGLSAPLKTVVLQTRAPQIVREINARAGH
jgi:hypothetical protein